MFVVSSSFMGIFAWLSYGQKKNLIMNVFSEALPTTGKDLRMKTVTNTYFCHSTVEFEFLKNFVRTEILRNPEEFEI